MLRETIAEVPDDHRQVNELIQLQIVLFHAWLVFGTAIVTQSIHVQSQARVSIRRRRRSDYSFTAIKNI